MYAICLYDLAQVAVGPLSLAFLPPPQAPMQQRQVWRNLGSGLAFAVFMSLHRFPLFTAN
jgi:hypothetical protein